MSHNWLELDKNCTLDDAWCSAATKIDDWPKKKMNFEKSLKIHFSLIFPQNFFYKKGIFSK